MLRIVPDCCSKNCSQLHRVDAGHGNERADAVDDERAEQKQQAMAEIGGTRRVAEQAQPD